MKKPKVLVIGSNNFSGSHFVAEALHASDATWGVSHSTEPHPMFLPYRWPVEERGHALATAENFNFETIDLNSQLNDLLKLIDRCNQKWL